MSRLIDAEELKEHLFVGADYDKAIDDGIAKTEKEVFAFQCGWNDALKSVEQFAPTVDAEPVKHGHWVNKGFEPLRCSVCGITVDAINGIPWANIGFKFCPHCGAKMDEVEENE